MPLVRNEATLSFCHGSRSVRITTAILVSNCMDYSEVIPGRVEDANPESRDSPMRNCASEVHANACPGMTIAEKLPLGVAGPGADHAFLAAEFVAFFGRGVERARNLRLHRVAVGAAGIGDVDRQRSTGALHGDGPAVALALLQRSRPRRLR